jgi:exonuclease III
LRFNKKLNNLLGLEVLYTNIDGILNKKEEFVKMVNERNSSIVAVTEYVPKTIKLSEAELQLNGYDMFVNKSPKRGTVLYVNNKLNAHECFELNNYAFQESVWCSFNDCNVTQF